MWKYRYKQMTHWDSQVHSLIVERFPCLALEFESKMLDLSYRMPRSYIGIPDRPLFYFFLIENQIVYIPHNNLFLIFLLPFFSLWMKMYTISSKYVHYICDHLNILYSTMFENNVSIYPIIRFHDSLRSFFKKNKCDTCPNENKNRKLIFIS